MKVLKLVTATVLALGVVQAYADQTNLVQNVSIQLSGVRQGETVTRGSLVMTSVDVVSVNTRRVIRALGEVTGNDFSSTSRLVVVTSPGLLPVFQVRDGGTKVDVTPLFTYEQLSDSVHSGAANTRTGRSVSVDYNIQRLALHDGPGFPALSTHFDVNGFARQSNVNNQNGDDIDMDVLGWGDRNGEVLIIQGSVGVFGHMIEVVGGWTDGGES